MEPRALLNLNGTLSKAAGAAAGRRSVSVEMTQKFKDELVNTPVRGHGCDKASDVSSESYENYAEAEAEAEAVAVLDHLCSLDSGFSTPTGVFTVSTTSAANLPPATPTGFVNYDPSTSHTPGGPHDGAADGDAASSYSPTTPYYLTQGAKLVQMTCPPKQTGKGLFEKEDVEGQAEVGRGMGRGGSKGFPISGRLDDVKDAGVRKRLAEARRRTMGWRPRVASPLGR